MPTCKHCGEQIRWVESMGWVHGGIGDEIRTRCRAGNTEAQATDEWLATLRFIE